MWNQRYFYPCLSSLYASLMRFGLYEGCCDVLLTSFAKNVQQLEQGGFETWSFAVNLFPLLCFLFVSQESVNYSSLYIVVFVGLPSCFQWFRSNKIIGLLMILYEGVHFFIPSPCIVHERVLIFLVNQHSNVRWLKQVHLWNGIVLIFVSLFKPCDSWPFLLPFFMLYNKIVRFMVGLCYLTWLEYKESKQRNFQLEWFTSPVTKKNTESMFSFPRIKSRLFYESENIPLDTVPRSEIVKTCELGMTKNAIKLCILVTEDDQCFHIFNPTFFFFSDLGVEPTIRMTEGQKMVGHFCEESSCWAHVS